MRLFFRRLLLKKAQLNPVEREALLTFKQLLAAQLGRQLQSVKLFGSRARGDARPDSDIDVLVVVGKWNTKIDDTIYDCVAAVMEKHSVYLSVKVFPKEEYVRLNQIPTVFFQIVRRDAISV